MNMNGLADGCIVLYYITETSFFNLQKEEKKERRITWKGHGKSSS